MANKKISQLPLLTGVTENDILVIVSNNTTYKVPVSGLTAVYPNSTTTDGFIPVFSGNSYINSLMYQTNGGVLIGSDDEDTPLNPDKLGVYAGITNSYNLISGHGTINNYLQINVQNKSNGGLASTDIVATKNDGDETTGYIDMGINASTYTATTIVGGPNDAYVYSTGGRLYIGNATPNSEVVIFNGGIDAINEAKVFIHDNGTVAINTNTNDDQNPAGLRVFSPTSTSFNLIYGQGEIDYYSQFNIKNVNSGLSASTDIVATNDIGTESTYYVNVGINSSNHELHTEMGPGRANDTYFLSVNSGGKTYFGSATNGNLIFHTGNDFDGDANAKLILTSNSGHTINGNILISGNTNVTNQINTQTISATTYLNLPVDVFVTGGTYSNGTATFRNNTGGTFSVTGFTSGGTVNNTDVFVTGGTYSNGVILFKNNTGGTFTVTNLFSGSTDVFVTGGTYNAGAGTITFRNNTGGTFSVTGFTSGGTVNNTDVFVTGGTYSNGTATFTNNTGGTFNVTGFTSGGTTNKQSIASALGFIPSPMAYSFPSNVHNPEFMVLASGIARPTNAFSHGQPITWAFLTSSDGHGSTFFESVTGVSNSRLSVSYPNVKYVFNFTITPDESFAGVNVNVGATVGFTSAESAVTRLVPLGVRLTGNGAGTWTKTGANSSVFDVTTFNTGDGGTSFNIDTSQANVYNTDYNFINIQYIGPNRYSIKRLYSGLGAYNIRFVILDASGNTLTTNPTTSDEIIIGNCGLVAKTIPMNTYTATDNAFLTSSYNWWILGLFEAWMIVTPESTTSTWVKFQNNYTNATNYKVYRDTSSTFATQTLIYSGTSGSYNDTGLSSNTLYHYKLVGVVSGVDTQITTFRCKTLS
jgi:hypothetical protein